VPGPGRAAHLAISRQKFHEKKVMMMTEVVVVVKVYRIPA
jgi:hypothetical protein